MNGLQTLACHPSDKHQVHTAHKSNITLSRYRYGTVIRKQLHHRTLKKPDCLINRLVVYSI